MKREPPKVEELKHELSFKILAPPIFKPFSPEYLLFRPVPILPFGKRRCRKSSHSFEKTFVTYEYSHSEYCFQEPFVPKRNNGLAIAEFSLCILKQPGARASMAIILKPLDLENSVD
ncbi:hypothetical protein CDAR_49391 [Caerostris darwini]|uniref:Uncharacterized protein n=1 Tax=Caerostris darwini TaxID=1538125 RepID=A0AAV4Q885_9ARAC|nr:hypothetical protein CDAR_49391 [Caerostris darwini]